VWQNPALTHTYTTNLMLSPSETTASEALLSRIAQLAPNAGDCGIVSLTQAYATIKSANHTPIFGHALMCGSAECPVEGTESESDTQGNDAPAASTTEAPATSTTRKPRTTKAKDTPPAETAAAPAAETPAAEPAAAPVTPTEEPVEDPALADEPAAKTYAEKIADIKAAYLAKCKATAAISDEAGRKFKESIVNLYTRLGGTRIGDIPEANIEKFVESMNSL